MQRKFVLILAGLMLVLGLMTPSKIFAAYPSYTISPTSNTYMKKMMNYSTYNTYTKHYYVLRSYLEKFEASGGGTLTLKSGTYTISNTLYVPSNVTIKLLDGAKIVKGNKTNTSKFNASTSIFQLVRPSRASKPGVYGGYAGEKNIKFIGEGSATIDMKYFKDGIAIIAGHNRNVTIQNICFQNMQSGHFIEMDATENAVIRNNKFIDSYASANRNKEAINLDTPDKATQGWSQQWSKFDKTPNSKVTIEKNTFYNLDRAIGTHKYSEGKYHDQIVIRGNKIEKTRQDAIRVMNWSNSIIEYNTIKDVEPGSNSDRRGILASGAKNPFFRYNTIEDAPRPMQFMPWKNSGPGSEYAITYNQLSDENKKALETNTAIGSLENFIRINKVYGLFDKNSTEFIKVITQ